MNRFSAMLLLGPTGAGKTPLGACIEAHGWQGQRCAHFDFGEQLRRIAAGQWKPARLSRADTAFIRGVLERGALLEDGHFYIAREILVAFTTEKQLQPGDWIILNGLPRHAGQAHKMSAWVDMRLIVRLNCTPQAVYERIRLNTGGDRTDRTDDTLDDVTRKLQLFSQRTIPLLDHYQHNGIELAELDVATGTLAEDLLAALLKRP
jgi:adenylate kinase